MQSTIRDSSWYFQLILSKINMPLHGLSLRIPSPPRSSASTTLVGLEVIYMTDSTSLFVCGGNFKVKTQTVTEGQSLSWDSGVGKVSIWPFDVPVFTMESVKY